MSVIATLIIQPSTEQRKIELAPIIRIQEILEFAKQEFNLPGNINNWTCFLKDKGKYYGPQEQLGYLGTQTIMINVTNYVTAIRNDDSRQIVTILVEQNGTQITWLECELVSTTTISEYLNKQLQSKQKEVDELLSERKGFVNKIQNQSDEINKQNIKLIECISTIQLKEELLKNSDELIQKLQSQIIKQQHQVINYNGNQFLFLRQKELEEEDEGKLRQENSELRNRIQQYQQQIDIYIESRQTDLFNYAQL